MHKINILLQDLEELQCNAPRICPPGIFPSMRQHPYLPYQRSDNTLFFTSLILVILQQISSSACGEAAVSAAQRIARRAWASFPRYANKAGGVTYNFWQEHPKEAFPTSRYLFNHRHFHIPDDLDDTALAFLAKPHTPAEVYGLKRRAAIHVNTYRRTVRNTFEGLAHFEAYTTWSGQAMYYEFDICVLCNLLVCFRQYGLAPDYHDGETLRWIEAVLLHDYHLADPYEAAHHYAHSTLILYHLAKLCEADAAFAQRWRAKLLADVAGVMPQAKSYAERLLLANAALKLGGNSSFALAEKPKRNTRFPFFIIGLLTAYEYPWIRPLARNRCTWLCYFCEAYHVALEIEHCILLHKKV